MSLRSFSCLLSLLVSLAVSPAIADPPPKDSVAPAAKQAQPKAAAKPKGTQFIRINTNDKGEAVAMQAAIVSYVGENADGKKVQVDLIGVIHIADRAYYKQLNKEFEAYDALLYELVAPKNARPGRGEGSIYGPVAGMLDLDDQLAVIDYSKDNFVHADMTWEEMAESMKKRKESITNMIFRAVGHSLAQQSTKEGGVSDGDLLAALLFSKNRALGVKKILARQFGDMEGAMSILEGPDGSTLITERNKAALAVLKDELAGGKAKIGIFYGAGHLPDMESRLFEDFKLKKDSERWLTCWDLKDDTSTKKPAKKKE